MKNRVALIVPYFGKLPDYFQVFLDSCSWNSSFDWLVFSDDVTEYCYPNNVHFHYMTFEECKELVQSRFDFTITLHKHQKLCDYKCAYGYIFSDYIRKFDWWGHCDLDQIFGDLSAFVTEEKMAKYVKIYSLGHLTLYRNTEENNKRFFTPLNGYERYREVFTTEKGCGFDEWLPKNINDIYLECDAPAYYINECADVNPYYTAFRLTFFDVSSRSYMHSTIKNSLFEWNKGKVYQVYLEKGKLCRKEYPYVHLQKRKMKDCRNRKDAERYYIVPNRFLDWHENAVNILHGLQWKTFFNTQFFKVKWKSLQYRIKCRDWERNSIFRHEL